MKLLGGFAAQKWGRSRLFSPFFHGDFLRFAFRISPAFKHFGASSGEELGNLKGEERTFYLLHPPFAAFASLTAIRFNKNV